MKPGSAPPPADAQSAPTFRGLRNLAEKTSPWLTDVGSWIFGGLTAVNLVVISALITVGPVDAAIRTSTAALAAALPLNVAGIILLPSPLERVSQHARRSRIALLYSTTIAALSIALTLTGMTAAIWHMGRWIAFVLLAAVVLTAALVAAAVAHSLPPKSAAEKSLKLPQKDSRTEGARR